MRSNDTQRNIRRIFAGALALGLSAMLVGVANAQSGGVVRSGDKDLSLRRPPVVNTSCDRITMFDETFRRKIDESIRDAVGVTLDNPPTMNGRDLSSGDNRWINEFGRNLRTASQGIGIDVATRTRVSLEGYLDRVVRRMCATVTEATNWEPPVGLNKNGQSRRVLCQALEHFYPRVQARVTDVIAQEIRLELTAMLPVIPAEQAALMGPGQVRRIESELFWFVETLTHEIGDAVDADLDGFYDRIHARNCE